MVPRIVVVGEGASALLTMLTLQAYVANQVARVTWITQSAVQSIGESTSGPQTLDVTRLRAAVTDVVIGRVVAINSEARLVVVDTSDDIDAASSTDGIAYDLLLSSLGPRDVSNVLMEAKRIGRSDATAQSNPHELVDSGNGTSTSTLPGANRHFVIGDADDAAFLAQVVRLLPPVALPPTPEATELAKREAAEAAAFARLQQMTAGSDDDDDMLPPRRAFASAAKPVRGARFDRSASAASTTARPGAAQPPASTQPLPTGVPPTLFRKPHVRLVPNAPSVETVGFVATVMSKLAAKAKDSFVRRARGAAALAILGAYPGWVAGAPSILHNVGLTDSVASVVLAAATSFLPLPVFSAAKEWNFAGNSALTHEGLGDLLKLILPRSPATATAAGVALTPLPSNITSITLDSCTGLSSSGLETLADMLKGTSGTSSNMPALGRLSLCNMNLDESCAGALSDLVHPAAFPALTVLDVSNNPNLGSGAVEKLLDELSGCRAVADPGEVFCTRALRVLRLRNVGLDDVCMFAFKGLIDAGAAPAILDISLNPGVTQRTFMQVKEFFSAVRMEGTPGLAVELFAEGLPRVSADGVRFLFEALAEPTFESEDQQVDAESSESALVKSVRRSSTAENADADGARREPMESSVMAASDRLGASMSIAAASHRRRSVVLDRRESVAPTNKKQQPPAALVGLHCRGAAPLGLEELEPLSVALSRCSGCLRAFSVSVAAADVEALGIVDEAVSGAHHLEYADVDIRGRMPNPDMAIGDVAPLLATKTLRDPGMVRRTAIELPSQLDALEAQSSTPYHAMARSASLLPRDDVTLTLCRGGVLAKSQRPALDNALPNVADRESAVAAVAEWIATIWKGASDGTPFDGSSLVDDAATVEHDKRPFTDAEIAEAAVDVAATVGRRGALPRGAAKSSVAATAIASAAAGSTKHVHVVTGALSAPTGWPAASEIHLQLQAQGVLYSVIGAVTKFLAGPACGFRPATCARLAEEARNATVRCAAQLAVADFGGFVNALMVSSTDPNAVAKLIQDHEVPRALEACVSAIDADRPLPAPQRSFAGAMLDQLRAARDDTREQYTTALVQQAGPSTESGAKGAKARSPGALAGKGGGARSTKERTASAGQQHKDDLASSQQHTLESASSEATESLHVDMLQKPAPVFGPAFADVDAAPLRSRRRAAELTASAAHDVSVASIAARAMLRSHESMCGPAVAIPE